MKRKAIKKSGRIKTGKKMHQWQAVKEELIEKFQALGINSCELGWPGCTSKAFLGFAHSRPRKDIKGNEIYEVIMACTECHHTLDSKLSKKETYDTVIKIISKRKVKL